MQYMFAIHGVNLLLELCVYERLYFMMVSELFYAYVLYQGYMTMNYIFLYAYIGLMVCAAILGITKIFDVGNGAPMLCYICQLIVWGYVGGIMMLQVVKPFLEAKARAE